MMQVNDDRLAQIEKIALSSGSHAEIDAGMCVMEAVAYVAGESWSDSPQCACPVIATFLRSWNDGLPDDATRDRLLKALIPQIIGTRSTAAVEERRSYMALDWLVRVYTPAWLDLRPELTAHAKALRELESIADRAGATTAGKVVRAATAAATATAGDAAAVWNEARNTATAGAAARNAARAAAGDAARNAARTAAGDAARAAARAAAGDAAGDAARAAAEAAARNAARAAVRNEAGAAALAAARAALKSTIEFLQASGLQLVRDMIDVRSGASMTERQ